MPFCKSDSGSNALVVLTSGSFSLHRWADWLSEEILVWCMWVSFATELVFVIIGLGVESRPMSGFGH